MGGEGQGGVGETGSNWERRVGVGGLLVKVAAALIPGPEVSTSHGLHLQPPGSRGRSSAFVRSVSFSNEEPFSVPCINGDAERRSACTLSCGSDTGTLQRQEIGTR